MDERPGPGAMLAHLAELADAEAAAARASKAAPPLPKGGAAVLDAAREQLEKGCLLMAQGELAQAEARLRWGAAAGLARGSGRCARWTAPPPGAARLTPARSTAPPTRPRSEALRLQRRVLGPLQEQLCASVHHLAACLYEQGRFQDAAELLGGHLAAAESESSAPGTARRQGQEVQERLARLRLALGDALAESGRAREAGAVLAPLAGLAQLARPGPGQARPALPPGLAHLVGGAAGGPGRCLAASRRLPPPGCLPLPAEPR
jgi:hypothetical protein